MKTTKTIENKIMMTKNIRKIQNFDKKIGAVCSRMDLYA